MNPFITLTCSVPAIYRVGMVKNPPAGFLVKNPPGWVGFLVRKKPGFFIKAGFLQNIVKNEVKNTFAEQASS